MEKVIQPKIAYIYHIIGTLSIDHISHSIESMKRQDIHWDTLIIYNGGDFDNKRILNRMDTSMFDHVEFYPYDTGLVKGAVADWNEQFKNIKGFDYYFVHKADFYLADGACERFEQMIGGTANPFFVGFKKFDMREDVDIKQVREMAKRSSFEANMDTEKTLAYSPEKEPKWDGVMHAYNELARRQFEAPNEEKNMEVGACQCFQMLSDKIGKENMLVDDGVYAMHMFHEVTNLKGKTANKLINGERY